MPVRYHRREVRKNPKKEPLAHWAYSQKMEAATTFLLTGSWVSTAAATNIPVDTLKKWGATQWWKDMLEEIRTQSRIETQGKLKKVIDKSLSQLEDRIDNGDYVYNSKTGKITRRPLQARTLSTVVSSSIDKTVLLDKLQAPVIQNQDQITTRLAKIQEEFKRFSSAKEIKAIPISEKDNLNAGYKEIQAGLPERERVQVHSGTDSIASYAEQSPQGSD